MSAVTRGAAPFIGLDEGEDDGHATAAASGVGKHSCHLIGHDCGVAGPSQNRQPDRITSTASSTARAKLPGTLRWEQNRQQSWSQNRSQSLHQNTQQSSSRIRPVGAVTP